MKFYYVVTKEGYAEAMYEHDPSIDSVCEKCGAIYDSERIGGFQVKFVGKKQGDFYRAPGCYIGNTRFIDMLEKYNITGYGIKDIECTGWFDKKGRELDIDAGDLREISVEGRCGRMCDLSGHIIEGCDSCGMLNFETRENVNGLMVDEANWDGTDIFRFSNWLGVMICSEKFKNACENEKIKGIDFFSLKEFMF